MDSEQGIPKAICKGTRKTTPFLDYTLVRFLIKMLRILRLFRSVGKERAKHHYNAEEIKRSFPKILETKKLSSYRLATTKDLRLF